MNVSSFNLGFYSFDNILSSFILAGALFFTSSLVFRIFKKTSLWFIVKGVRFEMQSFLKGIVVLIFCVVFGVALMYSGTLIFLSGLPIFILIFLSGTAIIFAPIIFGGIIAKYIFRREDYMSGINIFYGTVYLLTLNLLPYSVVSFLYSVLFVYMFGVSSRYFWSILIKNTRM